MELENGVLPREKADRFGLEGLSDSELIALLLGTGTREENVMKLSNRILWEKKGLGNIFFEGTGGLRSSGVGRTKAYRFAAVGEIIRRLPFYIPNEIRSDNEFFIAYRWCFLGIQSESALFLFLNEENFPEDALFLKGRSRKEIVINKKMLKDEILNKKLPKIIMAHNHPSGSTRPSNADVECTRKLKAFLERHNKRLVSSLVITKFAYSKIEC